MNIPTTSAIRQLDPYYATPDDQRARLNCDVSFTDANLVRQIYLIRGPFQAVLGTLFNRFCAELRTAGISGPEHSSEFLAALAGCTITLPRTKNDDGQRAVDLGQGTANASNKRTIVASGGVTGKQRIAKNGKREKENRESENVGS
jgi:hypothetical protein